MSFETGIVILSIVCFCLGFVVLKIKHYGLRTIFILFTPYLLAFSLYWGLVWVWGIKDKSEYSNWSSVFIYPWALSGLVAMLLGFILLARIYKHKGKNG